MTCCSTSQQRLRESREIKRAGRRSGMRTWGPHEEQQEGEAVRTWGLPWRAAGRRSSEDLRTAMKSSRKEKQSEDLSSWRAAGRWSRVRNWGLPWRAAGRRSRVRTWGSPWKAAGMRSRVRTLGPPSEQQQWGRKLEHPEHPHSGASNHWQEHY